MEEALQDEIQNEFWDERSSTPRFPLKSRQVTDPDFQCDVEVSMEKSDVVDGGQTVTESVAGMGIFQEVNTMFFDLMESLEDLRWDTFHVGDKRRINNSHGIYDNTGKNETSRPGVEGSDLLVLHSEVSTVEVMRAIDFQGVADAIIQPKYKPDIEYELPLVAFEGFKYNISLTRFKESSTALSYYVNYAVSWEDVYKVDELDLPDQNIV